VPAAPAPDLLADDEELIAGRRPVEEAFVAHRPARRLLVVPQRRQALERLVLHATSLRIPIVEVEGGTLTAVAGFDGHQGIALVVEPRTWAGIDDILARSVERGEPPFVLVLDSLEDPQNVGTLLRTAEAAGVHGVLFPTHRQAPLTPAAVKASAGAVEHLLLCPVDDLPGAMSDLRIRGLRIAAAEAEAPLTAAQADLRGPLAIVVGSEGQGLTPAVRRRADLAVRIPMRGAIGSLNAAVAGSILLYAAVAQREPGDVDGATPAGEADTGTLAEPADEAPAVAPMATRKRSPKAGSKTSPRAKPVSTATKRTASAATKGPKTARPVTVTEGAPTRPKTGRRTAEGAPAPEDPQPDELLPGGPADA
jgi:23S rRNA (guanosine2251-2'-O)-methyltransferase